MTAERPNNARPPIERASPISHAREGKETEKNIGRGTDHETRKGEGGPRRSLVRTWKNARVAG